MLVKGNTNFESFIVVIFFNTHQSKSDLCAAVQELPVHWRELSKISQDWAVLLRHEKQNTHTQLAGPTRTICWWSLRTNAHKNCQLQYPSDSTLDLITPCLLRFPPSTELATCPASHNTPPIQIEKYTLKPSVKVLSPNLGFSMCSICFPYLPILFQVDFYPLRPSLRLDVVPLQPGGDVVCIPTARAVEEGRQLVPAEPGQLGPVGGEFLGEKWRKMVDLSDFTNWWINQTWFKFHAFHGFHCSKDGCQGKSQRETIASTGQNLKGFRFQFSHHAIVRYRNQ